MSFVDDSEIRYVCRIPGQSCSARLSARHCDREIKSGIHFICWRTVYTKSCSIFYRVNQGSKIYVRWYTAHVIYYHSITVILDLHKKFIFSKQTCALSCFMLAWKLVLGSIYVHVAIVVVFCNFIAIIFNFHELLTHVPFNYFQVEDKCTSGSCTCSSPKNFESEYIWNHVYMYQNLLWS